MYFVDSFELIGRSPSYPLTLLSILCNSAQSQSSDLPCNPSSTQFT
jgi:hypothetical protein